MPPCGLNEHSCFCIYGVAPRELRPSTQRGGVGGCFPYGRSASGALSTISLHVMPPTAFELVVGCLMLRAPGPGSALMAPGLMPYGPGVCALHMCVPYVCACACVRAGAWLARLLASATALRGAGAAAVEVQCGWIQLRHPRGRGRRGAGVTAGCQARRPAGRLEQAHCFILCSLSFALMAVDDRLYVCGI